MPFAIPRRTNCLFALTASLLYPAYRAASSEPTVHVPDGFSIELVAAPPLVERPIVAAFDDEGRLYAAESSGSNDPVEQQLAERPHRIVRLEDADADGIYDRRTVFADRMMFPAGAMFKDGSLYVAAPPSIWKLTDRDGDGIAEDRVEWFQGKTLTGCANDLHGPYAGPDGWIYWCKGAFAEQTHQVNGREWTTRAAHIFRCRPDGSGIESVLTGGMDNPVDVTFTPEGERILSATLVTNNPRHDGLLHAIYGGVYGKNHGVLDGHARTGELMPIFELMDPASPSGLERYDADAFGGDYRDNLFAAQFNMRKVSRHVLQPEGASFRSVASDFVWSDDVDFHPTDVVVDADGSLLVIDTGGWYKLCCPTSQLWKPDVLGGIYRVRKNGAAPPANPRGQEIAWDRLSIEALWATISDPRPAVRQRASRAFVHRGDTPEAAALLAKRSGRMAELPQGSAGSDKQAAALARTWTIIQLERPESQSLVRELLAHEDASVRHAALHGVSLHRDVAATEAVVDLLLRDAPAIRRVAAEALGRLGDRSVVPHLLAASAQAEDRILQHSITYALIELADPAATREGLVSQSPATNATALMALDQMPQGSVGPAEVIPLLNSTDARLQETARWVVAQHPEWGSELAVWFRTELAKLEEQPSEESTAESALETLLLEFAADRAIQQVLAETAVDAQAAIGARRLALRVMERASLRKTAPWERPLAQVIVEAEPSLLPLAVAAAGKLSSDSSVDPQLVRVLLAVADDQRHPPELRVAALAAAVVGIPHVSPPQFALLLSELSAETPERIQRAANVISQSPLSEAQLEELAPAIEAAGPLELHELIAPFSRSTDARLGTMLLDSLRGASAVTSLRVDLLCETLAKYDPEVLERVAELETLVNVDAAAQRARIDALLPKMGHGDVRRGHAVFNSSKAACSTCHRMGNAGGTVGPELSHIGDLRTERDLLESILYPNLSFVRSYEPMLLMTVEGRVVAGVIRDETPDEYVVATGPNEEVRVPRADVEEVLPNNVSLMPTGLDKQLSVEELSDLVAFLRNAKRE